MPSVCKRCFILITLAFGSFSYGFSQNVDKEFDKLYNTASAVYERGSIDSAITLFTRVLAIAEAKHYKAQSYVSYGYNILGYCYNQKKNYLQAHINLSKGLANARRYHHGESITFALTSLSQLHHLIQVNNIDFPYKPPTTTVSEIVSFAIEKVEQITPDSCRITIAGGKLDGLRDSTTKGIVLCRYEKSPAREAGKFIGDAKIYLLDNNKAYATVKTNGLTPMVRDLIRIKAEVPVAISQSNLKNFLLQAIFFNSNSRERLFDRRYIYYYYDPAIEKEAFSIFSDQVKEIVLNKITIEDTTGSGAYAAKIADGLFKGDNVIKGMLLSDSTTYKLFLNYVLQNPDNYIGNDFKFSEVFATWVIYKTPLVKDDAIKYLIGISDTGKRRAAARKLYSQIEEAHLADRWLDDAVQFANLENIKDARFYARILFDVGIANKNDKDIGWAFYIEALCQNKLGNAIRADTTLDVSLGYFEKINDQEGKIWVANAKALFKQKPTPVLSVQTGHLLPYSLALSPNPRYFATGSDDYTIKIWDIQLVREIKTIKAHDDVVNSLCYSPGGRYIASSSEDNTIKVWNAYDYSLVQTIKLKTSAQLVKFTPDGRKLVCGTRDSLITFYDPISGKLLAKTPKQKANVTDIVFNPQNPRVMVSSCRDSSITFWDADSLKTNGKGTMGGFALTLRWSNDGNYLAAFCSDTNLRVLNMATFKWQYYYKINFIKVGHSTYVGSGSFSPDSRYLVFAGKNGQEAMLDLVKGKKIAYYNPSTSLANINFAANGSYFVEDYFFGEPIKIIDFNLADPSVLPRHLIATEFRSFVNMPVGLKFGNDSKSLYILTIDLKKFNFINGASEAVTDQYQVNSNANGHLVLNNNNLTTYVNAEAQAVVVYDYKNKNELKNLPAKKGKVRTYTFSANDSLCFIGTDKRTVIAYNVNTQQTLFTHSYYAPSDTMVRGIFTDDRHGKLYIKLAAGKILVADMFTGALKDSIVLSGNYGLALT
jgi:WD40 repeat protein